MVTDIGTAAVLLFTWQNIFYIFAGVFLGVILGAIPGLTATLGIALIIPITFYMNPVAAISMLIGAYKGGNFGGSIAAILLGTPGTDAAAATVPDGYSLAKQGKSGKALALAAYASLIGDTVGTIVLITASPLIALVAIKLSPADFALLILFSLTIISGVSGDSLVKGLIACVIGLLMGCVGLDPIGGLRRLTFDIPKLDESINLLSLLIGLFALPEIIEQLTRKGKMNEELHIASDDMSDSRVSWRELKGCFRVLSFSSIIGVIIGAIPGLGTTPAAWISYGQSKRYAKDPKKIGHGSLEGIAAAEAANNAAGAGTLIPMLVLGVPGNITAAILLGAFMIQGIQPGPTIFQSHAPQMYAIFGGLIISGLFLFILAMFFIRIAGKYLCKTPRNIMFPIILGFCFVGAYAAGTSMFEVRIMLIFGFMGYFMYLYGYSAAAMLIGYILGPIGERSLRQFMIIAGGEFSQILYEPVAMVFFAATLISVAFIAKGELKKNRKQQ